MLTANKSLKKAGQPFVKPVERSHPLNFLFADLEHCLISAGKKSQTGTSQNGW
jgi:hypothetical protein